MKCAVICVTTTTKLQTFGSPRDWVTVRSNKWAKSTAIRSGNNVIVGRNSACVVAFLLIPMMELASLIHNTVLMSPPFQPRKRNGSSQLNCFLADRQWQEYITARSLIHSILESPLRMQTIFALFCWGWGSVLSLRCRNVCSLCNDV